MEFAFLKVLIANVRTQAGSVRGLGALKMRPWPGRNGSKSGSSSRGMASSMALGESWVVP
jgi:hypothetical protein